MSQSKIPNVAQIGGTFIYAKDPAKLAAWYKKYLGIDYKHSSEYNAYYASFFYKDMTSGKKAYTTWSILENKDRPEIHGNVFCINYRVNNLDKLINHLKQHQIEVKGPEIYPEGKFAWITDPEMNPIELWEDTTR